MRQHQWTPALYLEAIKAFTEYSNREIARVRRNLTGLSPDDQAALIWKPEDQVKKMQSAVTANLELLEKVAALIRKAEPVGAKESLSDVPQGSKSVQALLQTFVREWSAEGQQERKDCFDRLLGALDAHLQPELEKASASGSPAPRVLVPGALLGRLPYEVAQRGYECEACEARVLQYFGSEVVRQLVGGKSEVHRIQPYALNTCNRFKAEDHLRATPIPEVEIKEGQLPPVRFGDFVRLYDDAEARGRYDAVVTAFSLDTSSNIFRYVRTVAHAVRPGGLWTNFGPLAYDTEHDEAHGHGIELSWEELRYAVSHFFDIQEESFVDAFLATNAESMMQIQYSCIFFKAVRNGTPSPGIGEKQSI
mmetsp:Transcript_42810/g.126833  ORF Transcript_42810/g.126833 Transcript_42810/m.126833 type:complete len:364 (+) Transcript_42810:80-1171(+)